MEFITIIAAIFFGVLFYYLLTQWYQRRKYRQRWDYEVKQLAKRLAYYRAKQKLIRKWNQKHPYKARMIKIFNPND